MNKQSMIRILVALAAVGLSGAVAIEALAAEVTPEMASRAVTKWRATRSALGCRIGSRVASVRRCEADGAKFNVVTLEGGGFVVTSADTAMRPVIFFGEDADLDEDPRNPLYALLKQDMKLCSEAQRQTGVSAKFASAPLSAAASAADENERRWADLLDDSVAPKFANAVTPTDIRVAPLVQSKWSQGGIGTPSGEKTLYNYYTPSNYVCGCVATAMAQIMRFHQYPTGNVAQFANPNCQVDKKDVELTSIGGVFDWANMPLEPNRNITEAERQAIGQLCYDCGVAVSMDYKSSGSGSYNAFAAWALVNRFGYREAISAVWKEGNSAANKERTQRAMITNFDAGLPVMLGVSGGGGHSIVGDGYGYVDSDFCCHVNLGWSGNKNGWYVPTKIDTYTVIDEIVYNIYTTRESSSIIVSGRILSDAGGAVSGASVQAVKNGAVLASATTNEKGIFALFVPPGTYEIRAAIGHYETVVAASPAATTTSLVGLENGNPKNCYYSKYDVCNVHMGDMTLEPVKADPLANVAFTGAATVGEDFASLTAPVRVQVLDFGCDPAYSSATLVVTLSAGGTVVGTQEFVVETLGTHDYEVEFKGLTAGETYDLSASVVFGAEPAAEAGGNATAARVLTVERPASAVLASDEIVITSRIDDFSVFRLLQPMDAGVSALTVVWDDDVTGVFAYWDGAAWQKTGVAAELEATNVVSVLRDLSGSRRYRVKKNGAWIDLAPVRGAPAVLSEFTATGAVEVVSVTGNSFDTNRIARADGTAEYADLAAAIAAGETQTLTPLWKTRGTVSTNGIDLLVLSVVDPNGLLTLAGDPWLSAKTDSDGTKIYCYGKPEHQAAAQASDYLKATGALGVSKPITGESEVRIDGFEAADGALSFDVTVDAEPVVRERVKEYVRVADDLAADAWRTPKDGEISVDRGRVTVVPETAGRAFLRVVLPKD